MAHRKDRLQDAVVKSIDANGVVFVEQVVDGLGVAHTRDVRKALRLASTEGTDERGFRFWTMTLVVVPASMTLTGRGQRRRCQRGAALAVHAARPARPTPATPIDVDFQGTDLRTVLRLLADIGGMNLVIDPTVPPDARVDLKLTRVPWDQVFERRAQQPVVVRARRARSFAWCHRRRCSASTEARQKYLSARADAEAARASRRACSR